MSTENIESLINKFVESQQKKKKIYETVIKNVWDNIMPKSITYKTKEIILINKTIIFKIDSSPLRHNLQLMEKDILLKIINSSKLLRKDLITRLIFN